MQSEINNEIETYRNLIETSNFRATDCVTGMCMYRCNVYFQSRVTVLYTVEKRFDHMKNTFATDIESSRWADEVGVIIVWSIDFFS